ncbi:SAM hydrolase/SAM-dependent halogenase family protein [Natrialbaceae archaeon A-gly3]
MITLATDFGSPYPAAMRGVIARRTDARLVDVSHDFPRQDVHTGAFWLREILPYYPPAVHLAVVDPGVGTDRAAIVVCAGESALVAPDNGLVVPAAREVSGGDDLEVFTIDEESDAVRPERADGSRPSPSSTFHGRDVFAPAAADVHEVGVDALEDLPYLSPAADYVDLEFPDPTLEGDRAEGEVLVIDDFGNAVTNVPGDVLEGYDAVAVDGERVPACETFAAVSPGDRLATVGSHGYVELDVNQGRGDDAFGLEVGDSVVLEGDLD